MSFRAPIPPRPRGASSPGSVNFLTEADSVRARVGLPLRRLLENRNECDVNGGASRPPWGGAGSGLHRFERVGLGRDNAE